MKNSSWKYPFPTFADKMFDGNKDGKLDAFETAFRDAHIEEMKRKSVNKDTQPKSRCNIPDNLTDKTVYNKKETTDKNINTTSIGVQLFFILLAIVVLVGGFIMASSIEGTMFIRAIILFGAVAIAIGLLKLVGLYE